MTSLSTRFFGHARPREPTVPGEAEVLSLTRMTGCDTAWDLSGMQSLYFSILLLLCWSNKRGTKWTTQASIKPEWNHRARDTLSQPATHNQAVGGTMSGKRLLTASLIAVTTLLASASAQKNEIAGGVGRTFIANQGIKAGAIPLLNNTVHFGNGLSFEQIGRAHV